MSCKHGESDDECELCQDVDTAWDNGFRSASAKSAKEIADLHLALDNRINIIALNVQQIDELKDQINNELVSMALYDMVLKQRDELKAQVEALRKTLIPFAALLQDHNNKGSNEQPIFAINNARITLGALRRAASAIAQEKQNDR